MKRVNLAVAGVVAVVMGSAAPAFADDNPFGTADGAQKCESEIKTIGSWAPARASEYKISADCKAEMGRRIETCLKDPEVRKVLDNPKTLASKDPKGYCTELTFDRMRIQLDRAAEAKAKAKKEEEEKAKLEAVEVPKGTMHDAKLEKAVAAAYNKDYPGAKILQIVLGGWSDEFEKDAFGRVTGRDLNATVVNKQPDGKCQLHYELWLQHGSGRSFSGPLSARGAGSMEQTEILCTKAEAGATASAAGATKKKRK
jgi:hypothetical protein